MSDLVTPAVVLSTARGYRDVRFHHQGRSRAGMDCAGLIVCVCYDLALSAFDCRDYGRMPKGDRMRELMREHCTEMPAGTEPSQGLVALMKFATEPQHLAFIGDHPHGLSLIHALAAVRKVAEHRLDQMWKNRIVALYQLPGVAY